MELNSQLQFSIRYGTKSGLVSLSGMAAVRSDWKVRPRTMSKALELDILMKGMGD